MPYVGDLSKIPYGWQLCDGKNGNPDLRGRFLLGTDSHYPIGQTGGEERHTITTAEMPNHNHLWEIGYECAPMPNDDTGSISTFADLVGANHGGWGYGSYPLQPTSSTGSNQPHNNMPPYFTVHWIIKVI